MAPSLAKLHLLLTHGTFFGPLLDLSLLQRLKWKRYPSNRMIIKLWYQCCLHDNLQAQVTSIWEALIAGLLSHLQRKNLLVRSVWLFLTFASRACSCSLSQAPICRLQMWVGWYCSGRQANFLREIVLEGQKQLRGLLQSVPAAAQLIYRQQHPAYLQAAA